MSTRRRSVIGYDALIVAVGGVDATRGVPGVVEHAFPFKSVEHCSRIGESLTRLAARSRPWYSKRAVGCRQISRSGPAGQRRLRCLRSADWRRRPDRRARLGEPLGSARLSDSGLSRDHETAPAPAIAMSMLHRMRASTCLRPM